MAEYRPTFKIAIMTPEALLYQNEVESVFITGDLGEYELMPYHYPVLGILAQGNIIINWREVVPVKFGILKFFANDCIILVEELERIRAKKEKKEVDIVIDEDSKV
ncbi:MAG: hypothetical protein A2Z88_09170 [Omnitrophica WOR_2 bacterium GWA2_47_8]|nr:MAG: hypothetical protein A2Z88_09170 [Omnitrophica WOR_2 bacterium GWA2_47_8]